MRLDRFLANAKIGTRSEVRKIIKKGEISVNGEIVKNISFHINETDIVEYMGKTVVPYRKIYLIFNKPAGFVSDKTNAQPSVFDLIDHPFIDQMHVAGRLDKDVEGLLILTNDGLFTHRLISPKFHVEKEYMIWFEGNLTAEKIQIVENGIVLAQNRFKPAKIKLLSSNIMTLTITEGKYHQVKKMIKIMGLTYRKIKRIRIGNINLGNMSTGNYRELDENELNELMNLLDITVR
jgi:16S rRNA pseudouridine516 synthase